MLVLIASAALALAAPSAIAVPPGAGLAYALKGEGVQVYQCSGTASTYAWTLVGPQAVLRDDQGVQVGRHFAGPTWQANDGSTLVGHVRAKTASPDGRGVDWLLLDVATETGHGTFEAVRYVRRIDTEGGQPPKAGCSPETNGRHVSSPYSATYEFYR